MNTLFNFASYLLLILVLILYLKLKAKFENHKKICPLFAEAKNRRTSEAKPNFSVSADGRDEPKQKTAALQNQKTKTFEPKELQNEAEILKSVECDEFESTSEAGETNEANRKTADEIFREKVALFGDESVKVKLPLNNEESQIYDKLVEKFSPLSCAVLSQVSMKAFVRPNENGGDVWKVYSDLYVDFLLIRDGEWGKLPFCVVEYFGSGHFGADEETALRVKRNDYKKFRTLVSAGVLFFVVDDLRLESSEPALDKAKLEKRMENLAWFLSTEKGREKLKERNLEKVRSLEREVGL